MNPNQICSTLPRYTYVSSMYSMSASCFCTSTRWIVIREIPIGRVHTLKLLQPTSRCLCRRPVTTERHSLRELQHTNRHEISNSIKTGQNRSHPTVFRWFYSFDRTFSARRRTVIVIGYASIGISNRPRALYWRHASIRST